MSKTKRTIDPWYANHTKESYIARMNGSRWGVSYIGTKSEYTEKMYQQDHNINGRDGRYKTDACGADAKHPSGMNTFDDIAKNAWAKRSVSKARRRYNKKETKNQLRDVDVLP